MAPDDKKNTISSNFRLDTDGGPLPNSGWYTLRVLSNGGDEKQFNSAVWLDKDFCDLMGRPVPRWLAEAEYKPAKKRRRMQPPARHSREVAAPPVKTSPANAFQARSLGFVAPTSANEKPAAKTAEMQRNRAAADGGRKPNGRSGPRQLLDPVAVTSAIFPGWNRPDRKSVDPKTPVGMWQGAAKQLPKDFVKDAEGAFENAKTPRAQSPTMHAIRDTYKKTAEAEKAGKRKTASTKTFVHGRDADASGDSTTSTASTGVIGDSTTSSAPAKVVGDTTSPAPAEVSGGSPSTTPVDARVTDE